MTATDELCQMLDEHGVTHFDHYDVTEWVAADGEICHTSEISSNGASVMVLRKCTTPAQAIAATLGDADATATRQGDADERNSKLFEAARKWMAKAAHFEAENSKLRELVADMWEYVKGYADSLDAELHGYSWPYNTHGYGDKVRNGLGAFVGFPNRMRELGVEVDG